MTSLCKVTLVAVAFQILGGAPARSEAAPGLVSITFDDGARAQYDYGLLIAREFELKGTIFLPTGLIQDRSETPPDSWLMSWEDVREFHRAGWEIGAHGHRHIRLTDLAADALEVELLDPIAEIENRIGVGPVSFSSPFGAFDDGTIAEIMVRYQYHLSWKGFGGRNPIDAVDPKFIGRLEVTNDMKVATVCGEMLRAAQDDVWLVLLFHGLVDENPGKYQIASSMYREILSCAADLEHAGVIDVVTVKDAMERIAPD